MRIPDFGSVSVLVVGDLIAERWIRGEPEGVASEAPSVVLRHEREGIAAGGAALLARHARALGADVSLLGVLGRDATGRELLNLIESEGIDTSGVELVPGALTATRTRVLAGGRRRPLRQILRIDRPPSAKPDAETRARVAARAYALGEGVDAMVVADEELGTIGQELGAVAAELARTGRIAVLDPGRSIEGFAGLSALVLGEDEVEREGADWRRGAETVLEGSGARFLLVTRGRLGMALFGKELPEGGIAVEAAGPATGAEIHGAGASSTAVFALALAAGLAASEAMVLANAAAGVVANGDAHGTCDPPRLAGAAATAPAAVRLAGVDR